MPVQNAGPKTLYDKVFDAHVVDRQDDGTCLLFIDRHLVHEVTSPQAFEGLAKANRKVRRTDCTLATVDHNIPTSSRATFKNIASFVEQEDSKLQCLTLEENVKKFGVKYFGLDDARQGIVHVVGPEQGFTLPGSTVVCGDSHTSTHGAFGALAFGIGTSEVEHVLATQCLLQSKSKNMLIQVNGKLPSGVTSKDLVLHIIGHIGTAGGTGHVIEFAGEAIRDLTMEARMSMCNMSIEAGARAGMIAPDETTLKYIKGRPLAPKGDQWEKAVQYWNTLKSDPGAKFDTVVEINAADIPPTVTWGTSPQDTMAVTGTVPDPEKVQDPIKKAAMIRALEYMGLEANMPIKSIKIDKVFIGSCTNSRIEDLRAAATIVRGQKVADNIKRAMIVPGSGLVKQRAEKEGLDQIFKDAGFEWREAGCSMCLGMNEDILDPYDRCASTSNRNFEGRQGAKGRTHLMSPAMAAVAAITGYIGDVREFQPNASPTTQISPDEAQSDLEANEKLPAPTVPASEADREYDIPEDSPEEEALIEKAQKASSATGIPIFKQVTGVAAPLDMANVDTDAIIPKQFLKTIKRTGLSAGLFYERRFNLTMGSDGKPILTKTDFVLNVAPYDKAKILVVSGDNFGCGSSREHAPWALADFGIRSIIAPSFGDIFFNNSFKNGLLPIVLDKETIVKKLMPLARAGEELEIDLEAQQIKDSKGNVLTSFDVEPFRKHCLVNGLDDIGLTLQKEDLIQRYEKLRSDKFSWMESQSKELMVKPLKTRAAALSKPGIKSAVDW
ncbi:hypothetical protein CANCADRAFT_221 [Tortispora caseinolytica NRRL Y-17796]|uniref:3-isopropylmalate dehydratase n=1 Tax=Tortispora caseinolytica NRRL Y-17796 TaxID=767744 RepID=A0A1E4TIS3_9ASCO|nr:hypothetical protein CANCADRAFT_221 [Tortispora caseinolytica NRRL Y-17796]